MRISTRVIDDNAEDKNQFKRSLGDEVSELCLSSKKQRGITLPAGILAWTTRGIAAPPTELGVQNQEQASEDRQTVSLGPNHFEIFVSHVGEDVQQAVVCVDLKL